jgi:hypothetical protein
MKRFLKLNVLALVALLFLGVADAWGLGIKKNVALNLQAELSQANGGTGTWNNGTLSWTLSYSNLFFLTDWNNCDLSQYDKMVINTSKVSTGGRKPQTLDANYRVLITIDEKNYTCTLTGGGEQIINIKTDFKDKDGNTPQMIQTGDPFSTVQSIRIGGNSGSGTIKINSIYFHKPLSWDRKGRIKVYAQDFNLGNNVTKNANVFTFDNNASISLDFSDNDLKTAEIESIEQNIYVTSGNIKQGFNNANTNTLPKNNTALDKFLLVATNNTTKITLNSVTFTRKKTNFVVTQNRLYFEDFENLTQASLHDEAEAPATNARPTNEQVGKYYLYGGRGKILKDPTFSNYYQNLADADEYTKSLSENFLRYIFTDEERSANEKAFKASGEATVGFWVNGQVAVDYELPLERGSMFCIFSNDCFAKADAGNIRPKDRPRFMFDLSCNGWVYSYMPNTKVFNGDKDTVDVGNNYFFYGEKIANSGVKNPLGSLFSKNNYANTLDQSQHKFYDDKKWHYVTYVMDKQFTRVKIYLDGVLTGTVEDVTKLPNTNHSECEFSGDNDYIGRTLYLRNIVLGGLTPHGLFYDQQYYSDAALAYDDISLYGVALSQDQIFSIIDQKNYNPTEWHYGDSFEEYNAIKGGEEEPNDISGLGVNNPNFDDNTGYLIVNRGTTLTIPNVPKNYYVRVEYEATAGPNAISQKTSGGNDFEFVGRREVSNKTYYVYTYKANKAGTYQLTISQNIKVRSIVITPYQYAELKYGNWGNTQHTVFNALNPKYVTFNVKGTNTFYDENNKLIDNVKAALPDLSLLIDGRFDKRNVKYENIEDYNVKVNPSRYIKYTSTAPHVAHIDQDGNITMTGIAGNTTIIAELISDNLYNGSEVADSFEIIIKKEENTIRLANNKVLEVNEKLPGANSKKNLDNITMTVGGWYHTPNYKDNGNDVEDSWDAAVTFEGPVKKSEEILDEFDQYSLGKYVAKSESYGNDDGDFHAENEFADNVTPWTLPCRGAYVKFEPVKPGIVTMYLLQEGNLDDVIVDEKGNKRSSHVYWRPVYITDETGKVVDFVQTATNGRITYNDNFFIGDKRRAQFIEGIEATYNDNKTLRQDLINFKENDYNKFRTLVDNWANAGWRQKVIPTGDGGYMVMSKAIVRYTFNVHPGKTYYLFSNQKQIAISGFNFEEGRLLDTETANYETAPVRDVEEGSALNFTDVLGDQQPAIPTGGDDVTTVTYQRNFSQGKWSSICLPFSMNNRQLREQFGENTSVVLLKSIHDDGKIELIWHVNQDIIAGYPYFILPRGELKNDNVTNSTITKISVDAYFNSAINKEKPLISIGSNGATFNWQGSYNGECYKADYPYVFEGNFAKEELPAGSYVMSNDGALTKTKKNVTAKPFRAYLKYQGSDAANAKPLYTTVNWQNDDETTTSIDDIMFQNGILTESTDVYSIDGTVIRHDVQNLSDLSKGVYIVNGKKFVVK